MRASSKRTAGGAMVAVALGLIVFTYAMRDLLGPVAFVVAAIAIFNAVRGMRWLLADN